MKLAILVTGLVLAAIAPTRTLAPRPATPPVPAKTGYQIKTSHHTSSLVPLATMKALPSQKVVRPTSMPVGVVTNSRDWAKVSSAAKLKFPAIDWKRQMVVYAVLGAQTNSLSFNKWSVKGTSATLSLNWSGIEPYYFDRTPAVFAVVNRSGIKTIAFVENGRRTATTRGTVAVR